MLLRSTGALLFPRRNANPDGTRPRTTSSVARTLQRWQADIDARDEAGQALRARIMPDHVGNRDFVHAYVPLSITHISNTSVPR